MLCPMLCPNWGLQVLGADVLFSWCPKGFPNLIDDEPVDVPALIENNANVAAVVERCV